MIARSRFFLRAAATLSSAADDLLAMVDFVDDVDLVVADLVAAAAVAAEAVGLLAGDFVRLDLGVAVVVLMTMVCFGFPQDRDIFLTVNKKLFKRLLL